MCSAPDPAVARGRFITLEGGEGAGKSTQLGLLAEALRRDGRRVLQTREPGGAPGAERLRALLLEPGADWSPVAELLLHLAARAEHVAKTILPALAAGSWVVCDRFVDSTHAYQGAGQGIDPALIARLGGAIALVPDLTIVLDVPEAIRVARLAARGQRLDRYEALPPAFHMRVRRAFQEIAAAAPVRCGLLPADGPVDAVHQSILALVRARLPA